MLHLIPQVKSLALTGGTLPTNTVRCVTPDVDSRVLGAIGKLPQSPDGIPLQVIVTGDSGESYTLTVAADGITISAPGPAGAFYGVQTLRQVLLADEIPCLHIEDAPDLAFRGFYHDITRGRIATLDYLKSMVDKLAFFKINAFQVYVEHTFPFKEFEDVQEQFGCITPEELRELDAYCRENFIDFAPSMPTFGHVYELLHQEKYRHLRICRDREDDQHFWQNRQANHTIDPLLPESIQLITGMIDQYMPCFTSDFFNICCDETYDLKQYEAKGYDSARLYVDFVKKIIAHVKSRGKRVMMWADILLEHPEVIEELPEDTLFLNWEYSNVPAEEKIARFANLNRQQVLCPSTRSWKRLCEDINCATSNISTMAGYAKKYHALGMMNTSWGDFAHSCSPELMMYSMTLGAAKAWAPDMPVDEVFDNAVNALLYGSSTGVRHLRELCGLHGSANWQCVLDDYMKLRYQIGEGGFESPNIDVPAYQQQVTAYLEALKGERWEHDEFRQDMLLAAEGMLVMAELAKRLHKLPVDRITDTADWLRRYRQRWLAEAKESELYRLEEAFLYIDQNA
ncbi:MAG: hypothetical protein E7541_06015 [Ruminococcaceae bacterium]|nr:hypothetical protein [Oscillospiraceae bacterium]